MLQAIVKIVYNTVISNTNGMLTKKGNLMMVMLNQICKLNLVEKILFQVNLFQ